jgi:hypothetical protein
MARLRPEEHQRYTRLIRAAMGSAFAFTPERENDRTIQVERGIVYPMALTGRSGAELQSPIERLTRSSTSEGLPVPGEAARPRAVEPPATQTTITDRAGHARAAYPGLLIYAWAQAFRLGIDDDAVKAWREPLRSWGDRIEQDVRAFSWPIGGLPASRGDEATEAVWGALALYALASPLDEPAWAELAINCFGRLGAGQPPGGAFLRAGRSDNPEALWYYELVLLHAAASYAAQSNDALVTAAVMQAADYHLNETQPDHASAHPWALHAFIWRHEAQPMADQMLQALQLQQPGTRGGIPSMLLADALYCLSLLK